jgi:hypothetical protein
MTRLQHSPDSHNAKKWSPGRPVKGCLEPNALDALRRAAEVHAGMPAPLPFKRRTAQPGGQQASVRRVAA